MPAPTFLELARSIDNGLSGNIRYPFRAVADGLIPIMPNDFYLTVDATLGPAVLMLPSAVTVKSGTGFWLMRIDSALAESVTLAPEVGETINGATSVDLILQYASLHVVSDGTNWLLFAGPAAFALATDVLWVFAGQLATDQDTNLFKLVATRSMPFAAVDLTVNVAPAGSSLIVDWEVNGSIDVNLQTVIADGTEYGETVFPFSLAPGDTLQPIVTQVGAQTPGFTLLIRARGQ